MPLGWSGRQWPYNAASRNKSLGVALNIQNEILLILDEAMGLKGRALKFSSNTQLLGALPELDSMAVLAVISGLEERLGLVINDDEIDGEVFASVGSMVEFASARVTR